MEFCLLHVVTGFTRRVWVWLTYTRNLKNKVYLELSPRTNPRFDQIILKSNWTNASHHHHHCSTHMVMLAQKCKDIQRDAALYFHKSLCLNLLHKILSDDMQSLLGTWLVPSLPCKRPLGSGKRCRRVLCLTLPSSANWATILDVKNGKAHHFSRVLVGLYSQRSVTAAVNTIHGRGQHICRCFILPTTHSSQQTIPTTNTNMCLLLVLLLIVDFEIVPFSLLCKSFPSLVILWAGAL